MRGRRVLSSLVILTLSGPAAAEAPCRVGARYHGRAIDLDLRRADLAETLRSLVDVGRASVVLGPGVGGAVTVRLRRVPWDQALCVIARSHGLDVARDRGVYLITPAR